MESFPPETNATNFMVRVGGRCEKKRAHFDVDDVRFMKSALFFRYHRVVASLFDCQGYDSCFRDRKEMLD